MAFESKDQATAHVVRDGDSLAGLAESQGLTWQELALYNWGTDVPEEINEFLYHVVGVRKRAPDGVNWSFSSDDVSRGTHPQNGIVFLPKPFAMEGCAVGSRHTVLVRRPDAASFKSLRIVTDLKPDELTQDRGVFRLTSSSPTAYDRRLSVSDDHVVVGETLELLFEGLDFEGRYTLVVEFEDGRVETLFEDLSYGELAKVSDIPAVEPT